jgi:excisionase family DNA binding protein
MSNSKLLNVAEAAEYLGLKPATMRSWVLRRKISYTKVGRSVRIEQSVLDDIIRQGTIPAKQQINGGC